MTKAEYLEVCSQRWEDIENLSSLKSFYDIEKTLDEIWTDLGCKILETSLGNIPTNHRKKKKLQTKFGEIEVSNTNDQIKGVTGQKISPYLQEKLLYIGQMECYERGSEIARMLLNVNTNDTAIYRITDKIGEQSLAISEHENFRSPLQLDEVENLYVEADGSMLLTREEGWKEVKLGRIFKSSAIYEESGKNWIKSSEYVATIGNHKEFEGKMSMILDDAYKKWKDRMVFINDGARWQWNWIESEYPEAIQILDFFHGMENIGKYVSACIPKLKRSEYMKIIGETLKRDGIAEVLEMLDKIPRKSKIKEAKYQTLLTYVNNNKKRMDYPKYLKLGLLIGSGAIESAHRTVLQKRLKQAGQRWSKEGLKNIISLRVLNMSGYWDKITDLIKNAA